MPPLREPRRAPHAAARARTARPVAAPTAEPARSGGVLRRLPWPRGPSRDVADQRTRPGPPVKPGTNRDQSTSATATKVSSCSTACTQCRPTASSRRHRQHAPTPQVLLRDPSAAAMPPPPQAPQATEVAVRAPRPTLLRQRIQVRIACGVSTLSARRPRRPRWRSTARKASNSASPSSSSRCAAPAILALDDPVHVLQAGLGEAA